MNIKQKLQHPFALVGQGFALGAILFFATAPVEADSPQADPVQTAALAETLDA